MYKITLSLTAITILGISNLQANSDLNTTTDSLGEITVTPNRISQPLKDTTANVTIITSQEIQERGYQTLSDALSRISGFTAYSSGGAGQLSGLFLRGLNSGNILILLDGVPLKDPTDPSFSAGLAHLRLDDVDRIEVVKGAQSGIWGADAAAGVINIITKKAKNGIHASFRGGLGSYSTKDGGITLSAKGEAGSFILSGDHYKTNSFSAYEPRDAEADGYTNNTLHFNGSINIDKYSKMSLFYHHISGDFDYDSGYPINPNDSISNGTFNEKISGWRYSYNDGKYSINALLSNNKIDRHMNDSQWGASDYHGNSERGTINGSWKIDEHQILSGGIDYNKYKGSNTFSPQSSYDNRGYFGNYKYILDDILGARTIVDATLRYDNFSTFKNKTTYRFGIKRECNIIPGLYSLANIASSYKAPSLYQYSTNNKLKPESTDEFEIALGYKELLEMTYFRNRVKDRIDYNYSTWKYFNSPNKYTLDGFEAKSSYYISFADTQISANWTHMFSLTDDNGNPVLRVPKNEGNLFLDYYFNENIQIGANIQYVGKRVDYGNVNLSSYSVVNLNYNQKITKNLNISIQAHNILDKDYEMIKGYSTEGRSIYAKFNYNF